MFVALGVARERVLGAHAWRGIALANLPIEAQEYRDLLARCDVPAEVMRDATLELERRLLIGWEICEKDHRRDDAWVSLLVRYEAICDALDVPAARWRLSRLEADYYVVMAEKEAARVAPRAGA
jgi:hypothetical protein